VVKTVALSRREMKWCGVPLAMATRGIRMAGPHGTAATGGVRSPPCHRAQCRVRCDQRESFKRLLWLTSGPDSISYFQSFSIIQTLKFELVSFPMSKI
jgi:hypothetical protein